MVIELISLLLTMAAFLFLKGMTGALAPFSYLVDIYICLNFCAKLTLFQTQFFFYKNLFKWFNRTMGIRHQCRIMNVLSCHRCLINTGIEKINSI
jgi:hypothetical protein